jgi:hypothetical protein
VPGLRARTGAGATGADDIVDSRWIVIRRHWNALRVGDHVLVHEDTDRELAVVPGRVVAVRPADGCNELEIRIKPVGARSTIVHPRRLEVHLDELEPDRHCWRCNIPATTV